MGIKSFFLLLWRLDFLDLNAFIYMFSLQLVHSLISSQSA